MAIIMADTSMTVPAWATRVELRAIGGGGGGSSSLATDTTGSFCGAGGGAGGDAWGVYAVSPTGGGLSVTVGRGGPSEQTGGPTLVSYEGQTLLQAEGGQGGLFYSTDGSAGGTGGLASGGTLWDQTGTSGGDGQSGAYTFSGYGGRPLGWWWTVRQSGWQRRYPLWCRRRRCIFCVRNKCALYWR
ncbi:hypothetical protein GMO_26430 [Gluconobacter morbifer G707]|uniref:Glycine-rich domain-containing protein n=2 Tax=Gluconobacter TaxID=441 RepID=G6XMC5_9PROT|nr:hypothetical protein GMO_26430 [Gluconobacter morbifer G707]